MSCRGRALMASVGARLLAAFTAGAPGAGWCVQEQRAGGRSCVKQASGPLWASASARGRCFSPTGSEGMGAGEGRGYDL
jgi:hypothetical protein